MQNHPKIHIIDLPQILTYGSIFGCLMKGIDKKRMKKKKEDEEEHENVDMISHLPDPLLHHIFSFLDIKQAIQTCILSRRWRYFWVSLPILNFNYNRGKYYVKSRRKNEFMAFVDRVLILRDSSSNIQKLTVVMKEECYATYRLDTWIRISVIRNIQELSLRIYTATNIWEFPHCLSNCKSLTKLVLALFAPDDKCTTITLPGPGSFILPRLKSLCIEAVQFGDKNSIDQFFSEKCVPVLETLILIDFHFPLGSLKISSFKLKHLRLESCGRFRLYRSEIKTHSVDIHLDSPNLISFYYQGSIFKQWIIENLSSLVKANINSEKWPMSSAGEICYSQPTANILRELHNVEELTLSHDFLEISTEAPELFDSHSMLFLKLKCLKLEGANSAEPSVGFFRVIAYLLNACPNIETLCLRVHWQQDYYARKSRYCNEADSSSENQGDCWGAGLSLECLKFFEFRNVTGCVNELKFIEILLNKAVVLEKLFIVFGFGKGLSDDKKCRVKFREKFVDQDDDEMPDLDSIVLPKLPTIAVDRLL